MFLASSDYPESRGPCGFVPDMACSVATLQEWSDMLRNAPRVIGFHSIQVEAIRTGSHPSGGWLVSAFFLVVPGRRGVARRARSARRSRHGVALGPAVCPRNGTTVAL